jgi:uncharacterized membrane protein
VEITTLFGLPAHPLLVHIPIVLLPLVGVGAIAIAVSPGARQRFGTAVLVLAGVAFIGTLLAAGSGESLVESVDSSAALRKHVDLARAMRPLAFVLLLAIGGIVLIDQLKRRGKPIPGWVPRWTGTALGATTIALAVVTTGWLVAVGHNGAEATWGHTKVESGRDQGLSTSRAGH